MEKYEEKLVHARISLLSREPFWGVLATRLILKDVTEEMPECKTMATDGKYFYYNRDFVNKLTVSETKWCFAHEVCHIMYEHMDRRGSRLPKLWNAAVDYVINWEITNANIGKKPELSTSGIEVLFDKKFADMCGEEAYELLLDDPDANFPEFDIHFDGTPSDMSEEERRMLRSEFRAAMGAAAKLNKGGNLPAGVQRLIRELEEPQLDWREVIDATIKSMVKSDFTWQRCARKAQSSGVYLPGMSEDYRIDAAVALDTSGSMTDSMLRELLSEVRGMMEQYRDFSLHLWCFDTDVHNYVKFTPENIYDIDDYIPKGGGGTSFECNWEFMKINDIAPERFIMLTDGCPCEGWGDPDYVDTTFIVHSDRTHSIVAPFGKTVHYDR